MGARDTALVAIGFGLGAAVVVGGMLAFEKGDPPGPVEVSSSFCVRTLTGVADKWDMVVAPQETVKGERDRLTSCEASTDSGDVRLTLTVLTLGGERARPFEERSRTALQVACTGIEPGASSGGCDGVVETADEVVGHASAFATSNDRAVITIIFTAPPAQAVGTATDVDELSRVLVRGSTLDD